MGAHAAGEDLSLLRELLGELTGERLDECEPVADAIEVERLALNLAGPFCDPDTPQAEAALLPEALYARGDPLAAGILVALERLAPEPLARAALKHRQRLARDGVSSPYEASIATIHAEECYRTTIGDGAAAMLGALLVRPGSSAVQGAFLVVEQEWWGGRVVEGLITLPDSRKVVRGLLSDPHEEVKTERIEAAELARAVREALRDMVNEGEPLTAELLPTVLLIERSLAQVGRRWPRPKIMRRRERAEGDAAGGEPDEFEQPGFELAAAFAESFEPEGEQAALADLAPGVAGLLLDWKQTVAAGELDHWRAADLAEFLLDWYPRHGEDDAALIAAVPPSIEAFLRFLAASGRLKGDPLELLVATLAELREQFEHAAGDRSFWGIGKLIYSHMRADGVDASDPDAVAAWLAVFNARPKAERDRILGPALDAAASSAARKRPEPPKRRRRAAPRRARPAAE